MAFTHLCIIKKISLRLLVMAFKFNIILFALLLFLFFTCKDVNTNKNSEQMKNQNTTKEKQIIRITYDSDPNAVKTFEYNTNGDLIKQNLSNGDTINYEYTKSNIIKDFKDNANVWIAKIEYDINEKGKIVSSKTTDENNKVVSKSKFEYNAEDYLIKTFQTVVETGKVFTNELNYTNGNLKEIVVNNPEGKILSTYHFNYYDDKPNVFNLFLDGIFDDIFPNERLGKKNKNLVKTMTNISVEGDTLSMLNYEYLEINDENQVSFKMIDVSNNNETFITYYFNQNKK